MNEERWLHSLVHLPNEDVLLACGCWYGPCSNTCEYRTATDMHAKWTLFNVPSEVFVNVHAAVLHNVSYIYIL